MAWSTGAPSSRAPLRVAANLFHFRSFSHSIPAKLIMHLRCCLWIAITFAVSMVSAAEKTPLQIDDLYRLDSAMDLTVAPNLQQAIYVRDWSVRHTRWRLNALWRVDAATRERRPLEVGEPDGRKPVISPDGRRVAFVSTRPRADGTLPYGRVPVWSEPVGDIWLLSIDGGKAMPLAGADRPYGRVLTDPFYGRLSFSPDGKRLAFVADDGQSVRSAEELARDITVVRDDQGEGYEGCTAAQVWVAELLEQPTQFAAQSIRRLTHDDVWYGDPQWSPDGQSLVVHANRSTDRESVRFSINKNFDLWHLDVATSKLTQLTTNPGPDVSPRWSPDGKRLAYLSVPRQGPHADVYNLAVIGWQDGVAAPRVLYDHHSESSSPPPHGSPTFPLPDDAWLDARYLLTNTLAGIESRRQIVDLNSIAGEQLAESHEVEERRQSARRALSVPSNSFLSERVLAEDQIVRWKSRDGMDIDGVLTIPPPSVATKPYKLLVYPHGGPHGRSTPGFNFTTQIFAAHGYAVFQPNFRGSTGYGRAFLDADRRDLGGGDMHDILTGIEQLIRDGVVDRERQFVYGISYGGFMTSWLIGQTNQFRAAAPQNAVTDLNAMWGLSDIQSWTHWEFGGQPWEVPDLMRKHSPLTYAHQVKTPTLILHADHDRRCPLPMGLMYHRALKTAGVETEMVIYHNERHGIVQLPHQEDIYRRVLEWFAKYDKK